MTTLGANDPFASDVVATVRKAAESAPKRARGGLFSLISASPLERIFAPVIGLYLGYTVVRLPEVFQQLAVPHLPMMLMLVFIGILGVVIPGDGWHAFWHRSKALRIVATILGVAILTAPLGVWSSESFVFIGDHYLTDVLIFVACLVFLRDRRSLRLAVTIYVLCTAVVSVKVLHDYDPNAVVYNEDGDPLSPEAVAARPELRRLKAVGISLDPNDFGAILCTTFPLALWLSVGSVRRRVFWTGIAVLFVAAVVPTQSRGSELGFVAAALVVVSLGARGWKRWVTGGLVLACMAMFVMMATGIGAGARFADFSSEDYNVTGSEGRLFYWKQGIVWMLKRPWGYGINNYSTYFGMLNGEERAAHSSWIQYGVELGIAGLALFILLCVLLVKGLRRLRAHAVAVRAQHAEAKSEEVLAGHMLAMLAGVLVTGTFLSNAYYPLMYMALGIAAAALLGSPLSDSLPAAQPEPASMMHPRARRRLRTFPGQTPAA